MCRGSWWMSTFSRSFLFVHSIHVPWLDFHFPEKERNRWWSFLSLQFSFRQLFLLKIDSLFEYLIYWMVFEKKNTILFNQFNGFINWWKLYLFPHFFVKKKVNKNQRRWNFAGIFWLTSKSQSSKIDIILVMEIDFQEKKQNRWKCISTWDELLIAGASLIPAITISEVYNAPIIWANWILLLAFEVSIIIFFLSYSLETVLIWRQHECRQRQWGWGSERTRERVEEKRV